MAFQGSKPIEEYIQLVPLMERFDFDAFLVYDDVMYRPCWPILFSIAPHTRKLRIGPSITHPYYRHPAFTAANIVCLDEVTHGRAILGIGRGSFYDELGVVTPKPITAVKEAIEVVSRFVAGESAAYRGKIFNISKDVRFKYNSYRQKIPIFVGTWGPKLARVAGQMKEVSEVRIDTLWNPTYLGLISKSIAEGAETIGRDPKDVEISIGPQTSVSTDRNAARNYVRKTLPDYLAFPPYWPMTDKIGIDRDEIKQITEAVSKDDYPAAEKLISDHTIDNMTASGTPEDIIHGAKRMIHAGVSHISFCIPHGPDVKEAINLIGRDVIPSLISSEERA